MSLRDGVIKIAHLYLVINTISKQGDSPNQTSYLLLNYCLFYASFFTDIIINNKK